MPSDRDLRADLAAQVRRRRESLGWSQQRLAERAGLAIATVSRIERQVGDPSLAALTAVARALDCEVVDLFAAPGRSRRGPR